MKWALFLAVCGEKWKERGENGRSVEGEGEGEERKVESGNGGISEEAIDGSVGLVGEIG